MVELFSPGETLRSGRPRELLRGLAISLSTLVVLLALFELGARAWTGEWRWTHFPSRTLRALRLTDLLQEKTPADYDDRLGWVPRPNTRGLKGGWTQPVNIGSDGLRESGAPLHSGPAVLALGDSFTFGVDCTDDQTWPARLGARLGRPVLNGGVFGYGIDQMVLRLQALLPALRPRPRVVILSFIEDDIRRSEDRQRFGAFKPFFRVEKEALVLETAHIRPPIPGGPELGWVHRLLGYSFFADWLFTRFWPDYWLGGPSSKVHGGGEAVAGLLMRELASLGRAEGIAMLVMAQYWKDISAEDAAACGRVLAAARDAGIATLDLAPRLLRLKEQEPRRYQRLFHGHMTAEGNDWVAAQLETYLRGSDEFQRALELQ